MYNVQWHTLYGDKTGNSARRVLPPLIDLFGAKSVVEVGCGNAHWTQAAMNSGASDYAVVDGKWNDRDALLVDKDRFVEADLAQPLSLGRRFDLAMCLEVAEHVEHGSAEVLVGSLAGLSDVVLFGAAIPLQGGYGHINEQWPSYWRDRFAKLGYEPYDLVRPRHWHDTAIHYWYRQNAFVYVNTANAAATEAARQASGGGGIALFDAVHPEKFHEMADYQGIALKRLARRLPKWVATRVRNKLAGLN